uniref:Coatomer subunit delta n=1 Tax=Lepeophtheirus salmonis TaxID=72036 RepID=A0A0K2TRS3_LEPSM
MVLIAAGVSTKGGKSLLSRQFVEMNKSRIEGLLAAFPKLMGGGSKQHTFVETDSVRYVYQPLDKIYVLLITTKTSNILEDLETLRLFARVILEYCRTMEESEILDNAFNLIFAFDEIVALGYRESVNLAQIRTFVEMDSHEEKVYQAVRQTQEREAKQKSREKAKELQRQKIEIQKRGGRSSGGISFGGYGSSGGFSSSMMGSGSGDTLSTPAEPPKPTYSSSSSKKQLLPSKAMKLGGKSKDVDSFVDQLKSEGQTVSELTTQSSKIVPSVQKSQINIESVHAKLEEKINLSGGRDGGLESMEISGMLTLRITDESLARIILKLEDSTKSMNLVQLQTHPNIDKEHLKKFNQIGLKNSNKPFPLNTDVGVLKWRFQSTDESYIPLTINCWPSDNGQGGCDVNIEYELENTNLELNDVVITISMPHGAATPVVAECVGDYTYERRGVLLWQLPLINGSNKAGSMEFSANGQPDDFFPVNVSFYSKKLFSGIEVEDVIFVQDGGSVKHSVESILTTDKYQIV